MATTIKEKIEAIRKKGREPVEINPEVNPPGAKLKNEKNTRTEEKEDEEEE